MSTPIGPTHTWRASRAGAPGAGWTLQLSGDWRGGAATALRAPPQPIESGDLLVDASGLSAWDGALTAVLRERLAPLARRGVGLRLQSLPEDVREVLLLALPQLGDAPPAAPAPPPRGLARVGVLVQDFADQAMTTASFLGEVLMALVRLLRGTSGMRGTDLLRQIDQTGPLSIPIVALTCFLVGLMLAYMGGAQLDRIGGQSYIPAVVTVGMVRELAGLMTGVILSGRVGAAFAAQLATMKAGEEIDALRALGVDPVDHLVMPRLLALVGVAPLLIAFAAAIGVLAGMLASKVAYGLPPLEYLHLSLASLTWTHLWIGLFKGTLYAALVALAGCREGLAAGRNAQAVGAATTKAVVKALVWIVAAACGTTVLFQSFGL